MIILKKLLNVFLTLIILVGIMSTATLAVMATETESDPDTSSVVSDVSSEPVSSVESETESDTSSTESESEESSITSDESEVKPPKNDNSSSDSSNTSGVIDFNTSSEEEVSIPSGTNDANTSFSGNDAQTGNKYSTFIDESTGGTLTGGGDDYIDDKPIDDDDHFVDENVIMFKNSIGRVIWIPILFTLLAVGALIYINVIYPKNMGFVKSSTQSNGRGSNNRNRSRNTKRR